MAVIEAFSYKEDLIAHIAERLIKEAKTNMDLSRYAVVFPGKRPGIYITNYLSNRLNLSFFPPRIFTITEFMRYLTGKDTGEIELLDAVYMLFHIVRGLDRLVEGHTFKSFEDFVFWGIEIFKVIEEFDTELVEDKSITSANLPHMQEGFGKLLRQFSNIRSDFHKKLENAHLTTRGLNYYKAAHDIKDKTLKEFDHIYFVGLIALTKAEAEVIKALLNNKKASFFTQIEATDETVTTIKQSLDAELNINGRLNTESPKIVLCEASDTHEEVESVYNILKNNDLNLSKTAIVLPDAGTLLPLLSNVMDYFPYDYNVTMGYPLKRTPFYALIDDIFNAQESRRDDRHYYAKDYLRVLKHPYVKGMHDQTIHTIVQQLERYIINKGKVFFELKDIETEELYNQTIESLQHIENKSIDIDIIKSYINELHVLFFKPFEPDRLIVRDFADALDKVIQSILKNSSAIQYKFSPSFIKGLMDIIDTLRHAEFKEEQFERQRIFSILNSYAEMQTIPFNGIPLKGLQILGLLETRVLNFDRVILLDCNEGVVPSVSKYEPLLPLQVQKTLKLPTYREHEHVFRYHFRRLIKGTQEAYLIYRKGDDAERSRFIEEMIWEEEKKEKRLMESEKGSEAALNEKIGFVKKQFKTEIHDQNKITIEKNHAIMEVIVGIMSRGLSPSAVDTYIECPAQFYYKYILGLKETDEVGEEIEAKDIGSFIHRVLEIFYTAHLNKTYTHHESHDAVLEGLIEKEFKTTFHGEDNGEFFLLQEIIKRLLKGFIRQDGLKKPYILSLEKELYAPFDSLNGVPVRFRGKIDRIDKIDNEYLIIDYKTGSTAKIPKISKLKERLENGKALVTRQDMQELIVSFQLPMYLYLCNHNMDKLSINNAGWEHLNACLYMIRNKDKTYKPLFDSKHDHLRGELMEKVFLPSLRNLADEILDPAVPFTRDDSDENTCKYCSFLALCG